MDEPDEPQAPTEPSPRPRATLYFVDGHLTPQDRSQTENPS